MKHLNKFINILLTVLIVFLLIRRIPQVWEQYQKEGKPAASFQLQTLNGSLVQSQNLDHNLVVIFWATWCGPCEVELHRINQMIKDNKISKDHVLAISSQETSEIVTKAINERDYKMMVGLDPDGQIAQSYNVEGTPTIIFLDKNSRIEWMTMGLSPLLEYRIKTFLTETL